MLFVGVGEMGMVDQPERPPGTGEVVIEVRASGICGSDVHGYLGLTGRRQPGMVMGHEASGEIVAVGAEVPDLSVGQRVALRSILGCGRCDLCGRGPSNVCDELRGLGKQFDGA
jgi:threonine dehydrogenase-like Zn-dependent dehydrogenase